MYRSACECMRGIGFKKSKEVERNGVESRGYDEETGE